MGYVPFWVPIREYHALEINVTSLPFWMQNMSQVVRVVAFREIRKIPIFIQY
jgi:hypothetical protein